MASQIVIHPRSETLEDSDSSPHITVTASQPPESQPPVHTLTASSDSLGTSIVIIESIENPPSIKPAPMNRVIAISAPVPETSIKLINELQEAQTTSIQDVLQIVESNKSHKAEKRAAEAESNTGVFRCDNCDYSSNNRHYLKQHVDLVHNAGRPYKCPYCDYAGKRNHSLREHLVVHSNERPYECNHCNATFRKKCHLTNHVKLHASPKVVKCSLCGIALSGQTSFMDHLKSFHKTNKLFSCDMCEFITGTEKNIKNHMVQYHSESKLYQCSKCSYVTKDLELIESHLESHLKPTDHKMTPIPPKIAMSEGSLQTILNSGQAPVLIKCSECGYTAGDRENMKSHMIQHIQNKTSEIYTPHPKVIQPTLPQKASYKCTDCSFVSIEATAFIHHMLVHKTVAKEKVDAQNLYNIKPVSKENTHKTSNAPFYHDERTGRFVCTICGYGCEYQRTIKSHIWKHSGNKDIVYPIFHNGPLSVYEDNVSRSQPNASLKSAPAVEVQAVENSDQQIAPGTTICKIKISEDKMIAYMKEKMRPPIKLHEFSRMENRKPVFTNSVLRTDPKELAVVVEVVKAVPCTHGLTGMASQHNSPKRSLSPASVVEPEPKKLKATTEEFVKLELQQEESKDEKVKAGTELPNIITLDNKPTSEYKEPTESALALLALQKDQETSPVRAPFHNTRSRGSGQKRKIHNEISQDFGHSKKPDLISDVIQEVPEEHPELDVAEELVSSEQGSQSKSGAAGGICSSLLAVIEQLRERSKLDVDVENYSSKATGSGRRTSSKRRSRRNSSDDEIPSEFADTIEKILEDGELRYRCKFCHYSNTKPLLLRIHMRLHKSKTPFECSLCDFVARSMEGLQMHMIMHCKVRTYQCKLCPSAFNYKSQLRAHMRAHNEKDTYICDFCDFITSNCTAYHQHTLIHTDAVRSLSCPNCHKKFSSKYSFLQHVCVSGHGDSVDEEQDLSSGDEVAQASKELKCPHCEFSSIDISEFTTHMGNIHTDEEIIPVPLKCELCDFTAVSNRSLKSHMKRHINDQRYVQQPLEQYKCNLCGYVCHHLPSLKSHMWRHASDRNYSYEFTNDVINAAIDYDIRVDGQDINDPEILERVLNSERKIVEGRLNNTEQPGGKMPVCWVTFRCCQCGFETINKPELNVHMRSHSDIIQQTLNISQGDRMKDDIEKSESQTELVPNL